MPEKVLETWLERVNAGEVDAVASMYSSDAVLLPTFSNKRLYRADQRHHYFEQLSVHKDLSVSLHPRTLVVQRLAGNICSVNGIYCWKFEVDEEPLTFEARFTFTIDPTRADPILHHHSSQVPRML